MSKPQSDYDRIKTLSGRLFGLGVDYGATPFNSDLANESRQERNDVLTEICETLTAAQAREEKYYKALKFYASGSWDGIKTMKFVLDKGDIARAALAETGEKK